MEHLGHIESKFNYPLAQWVIVQQQDSQDSWWKPCFQAVCPLLPHSLNLKQNSYESFQIFFLSSAGKRVGVKNTN